jgi:hypothetical protein
MGSGTTAVAAVRTGRRFVGYDTETSYVEIAEQRIRAEQDQSMHAASTADSAPRPARRRSASAKRTSGDDATDLLARARRDGHKARELARDLLDHSGFSDLTPDVRAGNGIEVSFSGVDATGQTWYFDVSGAFTTTRAGLRRADALWKALGKAAVLHASRPEFPFVLITTDAPTSGSAGDQALTTLRRQDRSDGFGTVFDVIEMESAPDRARLRTYGSKGPDAAG